MNEVKYIESDSEFDCYETTFKGIPVRFAVRKADGEVFFHPDDYAKCLGYDSFESMMSNDNVLEDYQEFMKLTGLNYSGEKLSNGKGGQQ